MVKQNGRERRAGSQHQYQRFRPAQLHQSLEGVVDQRRAGDGQYVGLRNHILRSIGRQIIALRPQLQDPQIPHTLSQPRDEWKMAYQGDLFARAVAGDHFFGIEIHPLLLLVWQQRVDGRHPDRGFHQAIGPGQLGQLWCTSFHQLASMPNGRPATVVMAFAAHG